MVDKAAHSNRILSLAGLIVALGVVFGDIGTSPLYTFRATLFLAGGIATTDIIYGIVSLIFWTLLLCSAASAFSIFFCSKG